METEEMKNYLWYSVQSLLMKEEIRQERREDGRKDEKNGFIVW